MEQDTIGRITKLAGKLAAGDAEIKAKVAAGTARGKERSDTSEDPITRILRRLEAFKKNTDPKTEQVTNRDALRRSFSGNPDVRSTARANVKAERFNLMNPDEAKEVYEQSAQILEKTHGSVPDWLKPALPPQKDYSTTTTKANVVLTDLAARFSLLRDANDPAAATLELRKWWGQVPWSQLSAAEASEVRRLLDTGFDQIAATIKSQPESRIKARSGAEVLALVSGDTETYHSNKVEIPQLSAAPTEAEQKAQDRLIKLTNVLAETYVPGDSERPGEYFKRRSEWMEAHERKVKDAQRTLGLTEDERKAYIDPALVDVRAKKDLLARLQNGENPIGYEKAPDAIAPMDRVTKDLDGKAVSVQHMLWEDVATGVLPPEIEDRMRELGLASLEGKTPTEIKIALERAERQIKDMQEKSNLTVEQQDYMDRHTARAKDFLTNLRAAEEADKEKERYRLREEQSLPYRSEFQLTEDQIRQFMKNPLGYLLWYRNEYKKAVSEGQLDDPRIESLQKTITLLESYFLDTTYEVALAKLQRDHLDKTQPGLAEQILKFGRIKDPAERQRLWEAQHKIIRLARDSMIHTQIMYTLDLQGADMVKDPSRVVGMFTHLGLRGAVNLRRGYGGLSNEFVGVLQNEFLAQVRDIQAGKSKAMNPAETRRLALQKTKEKLHTSENIAYYKPMFDAFMKDSVGGVEHLFPDWDKVVFDESMIDSIVDDAYASWRVFGLENYQAARQAEPQWKDWLRESLRPNAGNFTTKRQRYERDWETVLLGQDLVNGRLLKWGADGTQLSFVRQGALAEVSANPELKKHANKQIKREEERLQQLQQLLREQDRLRKEAQIAESQNNTDLAKRLRDQASRLISVDEKMHWLELYATHNKNAADYWFNNSDELLAHLGSIGRFSFEDKKDFERQVMVSVGIPFYEDKMNANHHILQSAWRQQVEALRPLAATQRWGAKYDELNQGLMRHGDLRSWYYNAHHEVHHGGSEQKKAIAAVAHMAAYRPHEMLFIDAKYHTDNGLTIAPFDREKYTKVTEAFGFVHRAFFQRGLTDANYTDVTPEHAAVIHDVFSKKNFGITEDEYKDELKAYAARFDHRKVEQIVHDVGDWAKYFRSPVYWDDIPWADIDPNNLVFERSKGDPYARGWGDSLSMLGVSDKLVSAMTFDKKIMLQNAQEASLTTRGIAGPDKAAAQRALTFIAYVNSCEGHLSPLEGVAEGEWLTSEAQKITGSDGTPALSLQDKHNEIKEFTAVIGFEETDSPLYRELMETQTGITDWNDWLKGHHGPIAKVANALPGRHNYERLVGFLNKHAPTKYMLFRFGGVLAIFGIGIGLYIVKEAGGAAKGATSGHH